MSISVYLALQSFVSSLINLIVFMASLPFSIFSYNFYPLVFWVKFIYLFFFLIPLWYTVGSIAGLSVIFVSF